MKFHLLRVCSSAVLATALTARLASAQTDASPPARSLLMAPEPAEDLNRFGLSYRVGFNIKASFKNVGVSPATSPGPARGGVPHTYNDGAVLVDYSGNEGGMTMNWRYDRANQVFGDRIVMSASNPGSLANGVSDDPQQGFELTYARKLGMIGQCPWGLEGAFAYTDLTFHNTTTSSSGPVTVDAYSLGGYPAPLAPHLGSFYGPDPVINDTPTRLPVTVTSHLNGSLYGFRLGPYMDLPLVLGCTLTLSGGFALGVLDTEFSFAQSAVGPDGISLSTSGSGSKSGVVPGGYVAGALSCKLGRSLNVFAGVQYQGMATYSQTVSDKRAELDMGAAFFATAGLGTFFEP